jgi:chorismate synthase
MSRFRFVTAGESHGPSLTVVITGVPAGVKLDRERIDEQLRRRQGGYGRGTRMKIESDRAEVTGGVRGGETMGSPVSITVPNRDHDNWTSVMGVWETDAAEREKRRIHAPRPGHADLVGGMKYDRHDLRDILERASARETAARVAAGAIAREMLHAFGIEIRSAVLAVGKVGDPARPVSWESLSQADYESQLRPLDATEEGAMIAHIDEIREGGETLGGVIAVAAHGVPPGLGSYVQWDEKLDGRLGQAILSVHAVKGIAIGDAIEAAQRRGSEVHDPIIYRDGSYGRSSNRAGGLEGGITNGEDVLVRVFMKPIATLRRGLPSVDIDTHEEHRSQWERSDVTAVPACGIVCEAMLAIVLADAMREKFGGDSLREMRANYDAYLAQLRAY